LGKFLELANIVLTQQSPCSIIVIESLPTPSQPCLFPKEDMQVKKIAHVAYNTTGHKYCPSIFTGTEVAKVTLHNNSRTGPQDGQFGDYIYSLKVTQGSQFTGWFNNVAYNIRKRYTASSFCDMQHYLFAESVDRCHQPVAWYIADAADIVKLLVITQDNASIDNFINTEMCGKTNIKLLFSYVQLSPTSILHCNCTLLARTNLLCSV